MPYFSYISMLHLYESLGWWRAGAELRKVGTLCFEPLMHADEDNTNNNNDNDHNNNNKQNNNNNDNNNNNNNNNDNNESSAFQAGLGAMLSAVGACLDAVVSSSCC